MNERVMIFVDGSNLLRGVGQKIEKEINSVKPEDNELHLSAMIVNTLWSRLSHDALVGSVDGRVVRRFWFGSYVGGDQLEQRIRNCLRKSNFEPVLFKKLKDK